MSYMVAPYIEPSNIDSNDEEMVNDEVTSILDIKFEGYTGSFLSINTLIEIEIGIRFYSMKIAVHFIEQYTFQNNFAVFKHKSKKFSDSTYRKKYLSATWEEV
ncbi:hypothetical protein C1646_776195 [Rhizophagus diaphanus]|nr:hypothetical protein C1646_776195 [Rhizophagus diaphanus] [Rhizophagus sp. MUCL 43196]